MNLKEAEEQVVTAVKSVVENYKLEDLKEEVTLETRFAEDLGLDPDVDMIHIVMDLEDELDVSISMNPWEVKTPQDIVNDIGELLMA